MTQLARIHEF